MELDRSRQDDVLVIAIAGEFDTLDVDRFSAEVSEALDGGVRRVGLELSRMTFINSTALGSLLREQKRLQQAGGDLACAALSAFAARNFRLLGLDRRVRCFDAVPDMVAYLRTVGADEVGILGENRVAFAFHDAAEGKERVAEMRSLHRDGLAFSYENIEGLDVGTVFRPGRRLGLRFRLPLYHPTHEFRVEGVIGVADEAAGKKVGVHVAFDSLGEVEAAAIGKFVEDMKFIREEIPPDAP